MYRSNSLLEITWLPKCYSAEFENVFICLMAYFFLFFFLLSPKFSPPWYCCLFFKLSKNTNVVVLLLLIFSFFLWPPMPLRLVEKLFWKLVYFASNFFFHFVIYVSFGIRLLKPTFIYLHCYTSLFSGLLSLLLNNAVSAASLSTRLWVIHAETKKATSAPPSCLFLIFWMQLQQFFCGILNRIVKPVCFVRIWGLQE